MSQEHVISFRLSEADAVSGGRFAAVRQLFVRPTMRVLLILAAILYAGLLLFDWRTATHPLLLALLAMVAVALLLVIMVFVPWQMKRHFRQAPGLRDEISVRWDADGISFTMSRGQSRLAWSDYHCWGENDRVVLLYQSEVLYSLLPKAALSSGQLDDIRANLRRAGVRKI